MRIVDKYGEPDEVTSSHLVWHNNGPWKKTIVYRDEIEHRFPKPHTEKFMFKIPTGNTKDPDEPVITESTMKKVKEGTKGDWEDIKGDFAATTHRISKKK